MPHDPALADRIRGVLADRDDVVEKKMFGGIGFMVAGKLAATANAQGHLLVRCRPDRTADLLSRPGAAAMVMNGRPMSKGWIVVAPPSCATSAQVQDWIGEALALITS